MNLFSDYLYRSSTPYSDAEMSGMAMCFEVTELDPYCMRYTQGNLRCFKNTSEEPQPMKYRWQSDSTCSSDESDYTSKQRDPYTNGGRIATATVTTQ